MIVDIEQDTPEWREFRATRIGASDIPIICGVSDYKTAYRLFQEKLGFREPDAPGPHMLAGKELEPMVRGRVIEQTEIFFVPEVMTHEEYPWAMASLDGYNELENALLEIKCNSKERHARALKGEVPFEHLLQMLWQKWISGAERLYYASYHRATDDLCVQCLEYKDEWLSYLDTIHKKVDAFRQCLNTFTPPEKSKEDEKEEFITVNDEEALHFASKLADCLRELERAKRVVKALEAEKKAFMEALVEYSDDGNFICGPVKMRRVEPTGLIDWKKLCEAKGIDEEEQNKYRKQGIGYWKVDVND